MREPLDKPGHGPEIDLGGRRLRPQAAIGVHEWTEKHHPLPVAAFTRALQLKKYGDKIDPIFSKAEAALHGNVVNQIAKLVDKHGPAIAEQAFKQVGHWAPAATQVRLSRDGAGCASPASGRMTFRMSQLRLRLQ